jgi:hypothetical protein
MAEAEDDGGGGADGDVLSFTLHLDKSLSCAVSISIFLPLSFFLPSVHISSMGFVDSWLLMSIGFLGYGLFL